MFRKYSAADSVSSHSRGGGFCRTRAESRGVVVPAAIPGHVDRSTGPGVVVRASIARRDKRREETATAAALHEIVFLAPCRRRTPPYPSCYTAVADFPRSPSLQSRIVLWA